MKIEAILKFIHQFGFGARAACPNFDQTFLSIFFLLEQNISGKAESRLKLNS